MRNVYSVAVMLVGCGVASAQISFSDNFDTGPSPLWGNEAGLWVAVGGVYFAQQPSNSPTTYSSLPFALTDFSVDVDINQLQDGGLWLRSSIAGNSRDGVLLVTGGTVGTGTGLYWHIVHNGSFSAPLNGVSGLFTPGVSNAHIRVEVTGDTYSAFVNGSAIPATTLQTADFASGQFALYDFSGQTFDNVFLAAPAPADTTPPTVTAVFFDGTTWAGTFRTAAGNAVYGFPALTGANQFDSMPWSTTNTIYVQFSEAVNAVTASQVGVRGINVAAYTVASVSMVSTNVAKITISGNFDTDRVVVALDGSSAGAITDMAGNKLAGTFADNGTLPSSGPAGVDFKFRFVVGVGDVDRNGQVRNQDTNLVRANLFIDVGQAGYNIFADIDGNGQVRNADLNAVRSHLFIDPPAGPGPFRPGRN